MKPLYVLICDAVRYLVLEYDMKWQGYLESNERTLDAWM